MKLIIANWKMHPNTEAEAIVLARASDLKGLIIAPPFKFLEIVKQNLKNAELGVQDFIVEDIKKYSEIKYVIIGHSERRALGETDEMIAKKLKSALDAGLIPILCVGESSIERASNLTESVISSQLSRALSLLNPKHHTLYPSFVIAYEPLWAIGSHNPATPKDVVKVLQYIKSKISNFSSMIKTIYGGSVDASNTKDFLREKEIDGLLVGGASLSRDQIIKIVEISFLF